MWRVGRLLWHAATTRLRKNIGGDNPGRASPPLIVQRLGREQVNGAMLTENESPTQWNRRRAADLLPKILGQLGSDCPHVRATAGLKAERARLALGAEWSELVSVDKPTPRIIRPTRPRPQILTVAERLSYRCAHLNRLNSWERGFVLNLEPQQRLSPRQEVSLNAIYRKVERYDTS